jgi:hypothetical protein
VGETKQAAKKAENSDTVEWLARLGLVSRGVIWLMVGGIAVQVALGSNKRADKNGALEAIKDKPFGKLLLVVLVVGFLGYAAWRLLEGSVGHRDEREDRKRWVKRIASLFRGVVYLFLAGSTAKFVFSGGGQDKTKPLTARVMSATGGRTLVFLIGAGLVIGGLAMAFRGLQQKFEDLVDESRMPDVVRGATHIVGTAGLVSRGLVFALVGGFLVDAAVRFQPDEAKGLDASLKTVAHHAFGRGALFVGALGLLAFALWSFVEATYRKL